ncbi:MAG: hypothetical protein Q4C01_01205 [Clostridia bacterium]|nr:hypothetical protein [Clostridia bacterium]
MFELSMDSIIHSLPLSEEERREYERYRNGLHTVDAEAYARMMRTFDELWALLHDIDEDVMLAFGIEKIFLGYCHIHFYIKHLSFQGETYARFKQLMQTIGNIELFPRIDGSLCGLIVFHDVIMIYPLP